MRRKNNIYSHKSSKNYVELFCVSVYKQNKNALLFLPLLDFISSFERKNWLLTTTSYIWIHFVPHKKTDFQKYYKRLEFNFFSTKSTYSTFWLIEYGSQIKLNRHLYKRCIFEYFTGMHLKNWVDEKMKLTQAFKFFITRKNINFIPFA